MSDVPKPDPILILLQDISNKLDILIELLKASNITRKP